MSGGLSDRIQRWIPARWRRGRIGGASRGRQVREELASEFSTEELQEFLEADRLPVRADPVFKEELRERLWRLVQERARERGEGHTGG